VSDLRLLLDAIVLMYVGAYVFSRVGMLALKWRDQKHNLKPEDDDA
jgi:hypothetical protein